MRRTQFKGDEKKLSMIRVFYWAAFYGYSKTVINYMILYLRWSPFIKSFRMQSVLTAAIRGRKVGLVHQLSKYQYQAKLETRNIA